MRNLFFLFKCCITIGAIVWLVRIVDWRQFWETTRHVSLPVLFISYIVYMLYIFPYALRWKTTARISQFSMSFRDAVYWNFILCFMGSFLPLPGTLMLSSMLVARSCNTSTGTVMGSMVVMRFTGMFISVGILALSSILVIHHNIITHGMLFNVGITIVCICAAAGLLLIPAVRRGILRVVNYLPFKRIRSFFDHFLTVFDVCRACPQAIRMVFFYSLLNQLSIIISGLILAKGIPGFNAPWYSFFFVTPLIFFSSFIPSIGGYGINQAAAVFFFDWFGLDKNIVAVYSIIRLIFGLSSSLIGAILFALSNKFLKLKDQPR